MKMTLILVVRKVIQVISLLIFFISTSSNNNVSNQLSNQHQKICNTLLECGISTPLAQWEPHIKAVKQQERARYWNDLCSR